MNQLEREIQHQSANDGIDIALWLPNEEHHIYPIGARSKELKYCPADYGGPFCIADHSYLFKHSWRRYPDQYWAEVVAYRIGRLMNLPVPPTFAAFDSQQDISGSLSEWCYQYDGDSVERYIAGGDWMQQLVNDFDRGKGTKHSFDVVRRLSRALTQNDDVDLTGNWIEHWGLCFLFDAVIGNTDRHQDNWGMLAKKTTGTDVKFEFRFAPYFDNGTSLGHEIAPDRQKRLMEDSSYLDRYVKRGRHHIRPKIGEDRISHGDFIECYSLNIPSLLEVMRTRLRFNDKDVADELTPLTEIAILHPFTKERAKFTKTLICYRRDLLLRKIDELSA